MTKREYEIQSLVGTKINRLTIKEFTSSNKPGRYVVCICDCGKELTVRLTSIRRGTSKGCGCVNVRSKTHGMSFTKEYRAWQAIQNRCYNKKFKDYNHYGKFGITVCDRWRESFENFILDIGLAPSKEHSIDRFPKQDGNYEPDNCRWATIEQQNRNRKDNTYLEHNGVKLIMSDWNKILNISKGSIRKHLKKGESFSDVYEHFKHRITQVPFEPPHLP